MDDQVKGFMMIGLLYCFFKRANFALNAPDNFLVRESVMKKVEGGYISIHGGHIKVVVYL